MQTVLLTTFESVSHDAHRVVPRLAPIMLTLVLRYLEGVVVLV